VPAPNLTLCLDAMRTRFELVLSGASESTLRDAGELALREIADAEARLSLFRPDSLLSHINRSALHEPVRLDGPTFALLRTCREVWQLSGNAFDPTVAPLMTALGLHQSAALPASACTTGFQYVELDEPAHTVRFLAPIAIDLGAIAKGHALDLAGDILRESGIACALLHAGTSSVLTIGAPPGADAWRIALGGRAAGSGMIAAVGSHAPGVPPEGMLAQSSKHLPPHPKGVRILQLRDNALGVSAHHGRHADHDRSITHILDPRTGQPVHATSAMAAVVAPTAAVADAWSTACLVAGHRPVAMPPDLLLTLL